MKRITTAGLLMLICLLSGCYAERYEQNIGNLRWEVLKLCVQQPGMEWDGESQSCVERENPEGCFFMDEFQQIEAKTLPVGYEEYANAKYDGQLDLGNITIMQWCNSAQFAVKDEPCKEVSHYRIDVKHDHNSTLCWNLTRGK